MVTKNNIYVLSVLVVLLGSVIAFVGVKTVSAQLNPSISLNLGSVPQEVAVGPSGVYFVPNQNTDAFFYNGYWWTPRNNKWYRSNDYNGRWEVMEERYVPAPVNQIYRVPNYRTVYIQRIPYGQWKKSGYRGIVKDDSGDSWQHQDQGDQDQGNHKGKSGKKNKHGK